MNKFSLVFNDKKLKRDYYLYQESFLRKKLNIICIFGAISSLILAIILFVTSEIITAIINVIFLLIFLTFFLIIYKCGNHLKFLNFLLSIFYTIVIYDYHEKIDDFANQLLLGLFANISQTLFFLGSDWILSAISLTFTNIYCILLNFSGTQSYIFIIYSFFLIISIYLLHFHESWLKQKYHKSYFITKEAQLWQQIFLENYPLPLYLFRKDKEHPNKNEFSYYLKAASKTAIASEITKEEEFINFTKKVFIECKIKDPLKSNRGFAIEKEELSTLYEVMKSLCSTVYFRKEEKNHKKKTEKKDKKEKERGIMTNSKQNKSKNIKYSGKSKQKNAFPNSEDSFPNNGSKKIGKNAGNTAGNNNNSINLNNINANLKSEGEPDPFQYKIYNYYGRLQKSQKKESKLHVIVIFFSWYGETNFFFSMEDIQNQLELHTYRKINTLSSSIIEKINGELVTPLNRSIILLDQALTEVVVEERLKLIELARMDSNLLLHSLNDILDFFRMKKNCFKLDNVQFSLGLLLNEVTELIKHQCYSKGIMIKVTNNCELLLTMFSDPRRLMQILINLVSNALKFTLKGFIEIIVSPHKFENFNLIKFEIVDTGSGIKKEALPAIFSNKSENKSFEDLSYLEEREVPDLSLEKFLFSDVSSFGRGLGLMISRYLVGFLGPSGEIFVSSETQKGSKFGFLIFESIIERDEYLKSRKTNPNSKKINIEDTFANYLSHIGDPSCLIRIDDDEPLNYEVKKFPEFANVFEHRIESEGNINEEFKDYIYMPAKKKLNLLIVDENSFMIHALNNMLKKITEYQINSDFCTNGLNAMDLFEKNNYITSKNCYDFVILNCQMQFMSGYLLAKKIKDKIDKEHYKKTTIIGFSSVNTLEEENYCKNQGIKIIINKISSEQEIISKLRKIFKEI